MLRWHSRQNLPLIQPSSHWVGPAGSVRRAPPAMQNACANYHFALASIVDVSFIHMEGKFWGHTWVWLAKATVQIKSTALRCFCKLHWVGSLQLKMFKYHCKSTLLFSSSLRVLQKNSLLSVATIGRWPMEMTNASWCQDYSQHQNVIASKLGKQFPLWETSIGLLQFLNRIPTAVCSVQWRTN